ncbi:hypothetical protein Pcinc_017769 [Petrolisthes cinctipes]|uniref:Uncharacterized protein n=1 Tax=Petrolisthes cinctipes TaxID=88211 RepID=A0AAE1FPM6_PETCI|nr:hypothetical protein Pcinc_017769 [Petrolisthes cinctipes]
MTGKSSRVAGKNTEENGWGEAGEGDTGWVIGWNEREGNTYGVGATIRGGQSVMKAGEWRARNEIKGHNWEGGWGNTWGMGGESMGQQRVVKMGYGEHYGAQRGKRMGTHVGERKEVGRD